MEGSIGTNMPKKRRQFDYSLFFITFGLLAFGLMMIYSTSAYEAGMEFGDAAHYFKRQLLSTIIGLGAMVGVSYIPHRVYRAIPWWLPLVVAVGAMLMLLTPWAHTANGATRWFYLFGNSALSIQPAEIVKMMIIIFGAKMVADYPKMMQTWKGFAWIVGPSLLMGVIVYSLSDNLSSALIVIGIGVVMIFVASPQYKKYVVAVAVVAVVVTLIVIYFSQPMDTSNMDTSNMDFRRKRIIAWLHPELYSDNTGYQTLQALYAIGSGGLTGKGIGESIQKMGFIPEAQNDMIFAIICEELGLIGAVLVIALFAVLIRRLIHIAMRARDLHGAMLVVGVMAHISIQVILNIAVVTNLIPNTGISLPFISYGGSAVIFTLIEFGIVQNVALDANL